MTLNLECQQFDQPIAAFAAFLLPSLAKLLVQVALAATKTARTKSRDLEGLEVAAIPQQMNSKETVSRITDSVWRKACHVYTDFSTKHADLCESLLSQCPMGSFKYAPSWTRSWSKPLWEFHDSYVTKNKPNLPRNRPKHKKIEESLVQDSHLPKAGTRSGRQQKGRGRHPIRQHFVSLQAVHAGPANLEQLRLQIKWWFCLGFDSAFYFVPSIRPRSWKHKGSPTRSLPLKSYLVRYKCFKAKWAAVSVFRVCDLERVQAILMF